MAHRAGIITLILQTQSPGRQFGRVVRPLTSTEHAIEPQFPYLLNGTNHTTLTGLLQEVHEIMCIDVAHNYYYCKWQLWDLNQECLAPKLMLFLLLTLLAPSKLEQSPGWAPGPSPGDMQPLGVWGPFWKELEAEGAGLGKPTPAIPVSPVSHVSLYRSLTWARDKPRGGWGPGQGTPQRSHPSDEQSPHVCCSVTTDHIMYLSIWVGHSVPRV